MGWNCRPPFFCTYVHQGLGKEPPDRLGFSQTQVIPVTQQTNIPEWKEKAQFLQSMITELGPGDQTKDMCLAAIISIISAK